MSQPLRFKPVNPAHEMVFSPEGGWVAWEDYQELQAEVERLTDCKAGADRLKAEVERLDILCKQLSRQHSDISCENIMLRKAGDVMSGVIGLPVNSVQSSALIKNWNAAKEGKQP